MKNLGQKRLTGFSGYECKQDPEYSIVTRGYYEHFINAIPFKIQEEVLKLNEAVKDFTKNSALYQKAVSQKCVVSTEKSTGRTSDASELFMDYRYMQFFVVKTSEYEKVLASVEMLDNDDWDVKNLSLEINLHLNGDPHMIWYPLLFLIENYCGKLTPEAESTLSKTISEGLPQDLTLYRTRIGHKIITSDINLTEKVIEVIKCLN
jgi:hypothetical protein